VSHINHWVALIVGFIIGALFGGKLLGAIGVKA
jgi:cell shape-determining protein MreD